MDYKHYMGLVYSRDLYSIPGRIDVSQSESTGVITLPL